MYKRYQFIVIEDLYVISALFYYNIFHYCGL